MDIEWFPIKGFEGLYEWSPTLERVRGLKSGIVLKWSYNRDGRPFVRLCKNGKYRNFSKYMCIYSHTNQCEIPLGYQVHHIDFDRTNNEPSNLQLLTEEEHRKLHSEECSKAVIAVDEQNRIVHRFTSTWEAARNGFNSGNVSRAARGCYLREGNHYYKRLYWWYESEWLRLQ